MNQEINNIIKWHHVAADGVFTNKGTAQTSRNLSIINNIQTEATIRLNTRFEEPTKYLNMLNHRKQKLDSLLADSILFPTIFSHGSKNYQTALTRTNQEKKPTYGITTNIKNSMNPLYLNFHEYKDIIADVKSGNGLREKLFFIFGSPSVVALRKKNFIEKKS